MGTEMPNVPIDCPGKHVPQSIGTPPELTSMAPSATPVAPMSRVRSMMIT